MVFVQTAPGSSGVRDPGRRQRRIELLMTGTAGMYGDLQGIVGRSLPELQGLDLPELNDGSKPEPSGESSTTEGGDRA